MGTPALNPMPLAGGPQGSPAGAPPTGAPTMGGGGGGATAQKLSRLAMDAQGIASESPETAPMMKEVQNQVRMATVKMIQQRAATQQQTPQI